MQHDTRYEITWLVRRLFRAMAAQTEEYLSETEQSAADRAVMEFLYPDRSLTVPEIARRYQVSRQHVQVTVNKLIGQGLLRREPNPRHKRSALVCLSRDGIRRFEDIRRTETEILDRLFAESSKSDLEVTCRTLRLLLRRLT